MKQYKSKSINFLYTIHRIVSPLIDILNLFSGLFGYFWFIKDYMKIKSLNKKIKLALMDIYPILNEKTKFTKFDAHYFYHPIWAFNRIIKSKCNKHVDIASDYRLSGYLSNFIKTTFVDIRPIEVKLKNLKIVDGSILKLPYKSDSISSLSCLHVIEHIGLGRYGDQIDPNGMLKACGELIRVLKKNGLLYVATPIGRERICFNAHRISAPSAVVRYFKPLKLLEFSIITDDDLFIENTSPNKFSSQNYACGLYVFSKE